MMRLKLTQGQYAEIDDEDADLVVLYRWCAYQNHGNWYAAANTSLRSNQPGITIYLHRLVMGLLIHDPRQIDHRDGDGLNNHKSNLRIVSAQQNNWNRRANRISTSRYKGVSWHKFRNGGGKWRAQLTINGKKYRMGLFDSEEEAARTCDDLMIKMHGEFANLNFPEAVEK